MAIDRRVACGIENWVARMLQTRDPMTWRHQVCLVAELKVSMVYGLKLVMEGQFLLTMQSLAYRITP